MDRRGGGEEGGEKENCRLRLYKKTKFMSSNNPKSSSSSSGGGGRHHGVGFGGKNDKGPAASSSSSGWIRPKTPTKKQRPQSARRPPPVVVSSAIPVDKPKTTITRDTRITKYFKRPFEPPEPTPIPIVKTAPPRAPPPPPPSETFSTTQRLNHWLTECTKFNSSSSSGLPNDFDDARNDSPLLEAVKVSSPVTTKSMPSAKTVSRQPESQAISSQISTQFNCSPDIMKGFEAPSASKPSKKKHESSKQRTEYDALLNKFNCTAEILEDFDKLPEKEDDDSLLFRPVRKKAERAKLDGWACDLCRKYYEDLEAEMHPSEIQRLKNKCSKHRSKIPVMKDTPPDFWRATMPCTEELYRDGWIVEGSPFTPAPKKRYDLIYSDVSDEDN